VGAVAGASVLGRSAKAISAPAPFRVLYSNDTTNLTSCVSPYHKAREPLRKEMLEASVDEVAGTGVDVHLLQPGLGMVPMWPSKVLPLEEHYAWIKQRYGQGPDTFGSFVLNGGDVVKTFIERCRLRGQSPFISVRMNDAHRKEFADAKPGDKVGNLGMSVTRAYEEHPDWRINPASKRSGDIVLNWAKPEVRAMKLALITELCENYDLAGLELDFMRFYSYFRTAETTASQRAEIMTRFVRDVRAVLDRTERNSMRRTLCLRVPCFVKAFDPLGLDLPALDAAGVDMLNVSASYFTTQHTDIAQIRAMVPEAALYLELCHSIWNGEKMEAGYDVFPFRRATKEQMFTAAHQAYALGADGVSLFNFAYYREHGSAGRGPFNEPPFEIIKRLRDRDWLAMQPQHWFFAKGWDNPFVRPAMLPIRMEAGKKAGFRIQLTPPTGGWKLGGRFRIQTEKPMADRSWQVSLNGSVLTTTDDVSEPFANPYPPMLGKPEELRAWSVHAELPINGINDIQITMPHGERCTVVYIDLDLR
jgi:hypothetical protein